MREYNLNAVYKADNNISFNFYCAYDINRARDSSTVDTVKA